MATVLIVHCGWCNHRLSQFCRITTAAKAADHREMNIIALRVEVAEYD
jgi:hypothetical protein